MLINSSGLLRHISQSGAASSGVNIQFVQTTQYQGDTPHMVSKPTFDKNAANLEHKLNVTAGPSKRCSSSSGCCTSCLVLPLHLAYALIWLASGWFSVWGAICPLVSHQEWVYKPCAGYFLDIEGFVQTWYMWWCFCCIPDEAAADCKRSWSRPAEFVLAYICLL